MDDVRPLQYDIKWDVWEGMPITDIHFKQVSSMDYLTLASL